MKLTNIFVVVFVILVGCTPVEKSETNGLTYILDMVHNNPGEKPAETKYTSPEVLKSIGFNGMVPQWHVQCGLTYDSFEKGIVPEGSKEREWILERQSLIKKKLKEVKEAGLKVYPFTDMLVLPTVILEKYADDVVRDKETASGFNDIHGKLVPDINRPMTEKLVRAQIKELFETFPDLDGITLRFGETYLFDTPYHSGGSPVHAGGEDGIRGHVKLINILREEICEKYGKKLFYRTWDFDFFHSNPSVYRKITEQIKPHPNLLFSIKYTSGDFHRLTRFNQTLGIGNHDYIIEFQGQPEYYGKGAHPVYVFGGMLNGFSEFKDIMKPDEIQSVAALKGDPKFKGLWTWSRGGGWRGPYITNELWCDVNTYSAAVWAQDTTLTENQVLKKSLSIIGVDNESVPAFIDMLHKVDMGVLIGQCTLIDVPKSKFNVWWSRDQYFQGEGYLSDFINYITSNHLENAMLDEKSRAVALWREIEKIANTIKMKDAATENYLRVSASYGRIKHEIISEIFKICLNGKKAENGEFDKDALMSAIRNYDILWKEFEELKKNNPDCATLYEPNGFYIDSNGVSGDVKNGIGTTVEKYRKLCGM